MIKYIRNEKKKLETILKRQQQQKIDQKAKFSLLFVCVHKQSVDKNKYFFFLIKSIYFYKVFGKSHSI
jgi:hypothetical protein